MLGTRWVREHNSRNCTRSWTRRRCRTEISSSRSGLIGAWAAAGRLMLDRTGKPTPRLRASVLREELEGRLQRLQELEHWIKESAGADNRERVCADAVAVAIDHVQQAMDALELASMD